MDFIVGYFTGCFIQLSVTYLLNKKKKEGAK